MKTFIWGYIRSVFSHDRLWSQQVNGSSKQEFAVADRFCYVRQRRLQFHEHGQNCFIDTQLCETVSANAMVSPRLWGHG